MDWISNRLTPQVTEVRMKYKKGFKQSFLLSSDWHIDNPKCVRSLLFSHLDKAKETNSGIIVNGDLFCFMQGKYDPRRSKKDIREEHNVSNYVDAVISDTAHLIAPYSENMIEFFDGNHETAIIKNLETDPLERLCGILNDKHKSNVIHGKYAGFVKFTFEHEKGGAIRTVVLFCHHGKWGGVISKGTQSVSRFASIIPQADILLSSHTHDSWQVIHPQFKFDASGRIYRKEQVHLKSGTYKEEFEDFSGWAIERIVMPKTLGGWWLHFYYEQKQIKYKFERAK